MPDPGAGTVPEPSAWTSVPPSVRHSCGLTVRSHGLATVAGLLIRTMPYAFARFGILLAYSVACIIWMIVAFGGAAWLGTRIAGVFGVLWFVLWFVLFPVRKFVAFGSSRLTNFRTDKDSSKALFSSVA